MNCVNNHKCKFNRAEGLRATDLLFTASFLDGLCTVLQIHFDTEFSLYEMPKARRMR